MTDKQEKIIREMLDTMQAGGVAPWNKPWTCSGAVRNAVSGKEYRGMNTWILSAFNSRKEFNSPFFLTYKQALDLGGHVLKGQKGAQIFFYKISKYVKEVDGEETEKTSCMTRIYTVFNIEQTSLKEDDRFKIVEEVVLDPVQRVKKLDALKESYLNRSGVHYAERGNRAFYSIEKDSITLPKQNSFKGYPQYYSTFFHEAAHSTGAENRLNRNFGRRLCTDLYSKEELVAEMAASMIMDEAGFQNKGEQSNSVSYIASWWNRLDRDPDLFWSAAQAAAKAVDYIKE